MRRILLIVAMTALVPVTYARAADVTTSTTTWSSVPLVGMQQGLAAPDPGNCGTPYEPRACPPMPRVPLQHFPGDRTE
jgi:hypothetical protein